MERAGSVCRGQQEVGAGPISGRFRACEKYHKPCLDSSWALGGLQASGHLPQRSTVWMQCHSKANKGGLRRRGDEEGTGESCPACQPPLKRRRSLTLGNGATTTRRRDLSSRCSVVPNKIGEISLGRRCRMARDYLHIPPRPSTSPRLLAPSIALPRGQLRGTAQERLRVRP